MASVVSFNTWQLFLTVSFYPLEQQYEIESNSHFCLYSKVAMNWKTTPFQNQTYLYQYMLKVTWLL